MRARGVSNFRHVLDTYGSLDFLRLSAYEAMAHGFAGGSSCRYSV